ncbi:hypothetical protein TPENAI_60915 [Tenacibaculum litopenaei]|uniref:right-handed parallel beta-helix repeat-containing protein n=1 Tax=Tenacibaculum litopenaei TaxID=396016 RepID=UPI0038959159
MINVKDFGAQGNGTTDDTTSVQNAIEKLEENKGGLLYFPKGTYILSKQLKIQNVSIRITGDGKSMTFLKWIKLDGGIFFEETVSKIDYELNTFSMEHISLITTQAPTPQQTHTAITLKFNPLLIAYQRYNIQNVQIAGNSTYLRTDNYSMWKTGIHSINGWGANINNVEIFGSEGRLKTHSAETKQYKGILFEGTAHGGLTRTFVSNTYINFTGQGISCESSEGHYISNFEFVGVWVGINATSNFVVEVTNGHIDFAEFGINAKEVSALKVNNCTLLKSAWVTPSIPGNGITLTACTDSTIIGNSIINNDTNSKGNGIITADSNMLLVTNNNVRGFRDFSFCLIGTRNQNTSFIGNISMQGTGGGQFYGSPDINEYNI